ncbi:MAG: helix-hairpin-helix domain-containing protein [Fimbriimonas sp.]|nr:helix-hairpin-helix domain-containing protein [Fimbriimonas sp.]
MFVHLSPKERIGYVALGAILLSGFGFVAAQKLRRPAAIELHDTNRQPIHIDPGPGVPKAAPAPESRAPESRAQAILVHVAGAVQNPGLVSIPAGSRVYDAIIAAGGPTSEANVDGVNLAAKAIDGTQIYVPTRGSTTAINPMTGGAALVSPKGRKAAKPPPSVMDLNSASAEQLQSLPGVGPTMAQRVADYRSIHGPFAVVDDLLAVPGFGKKRLQQVRPWLTIQ